MDAILQKVVYFKNKLGTGVSFLGLCMYLMVIVDNSSLFCLYIFVLEDLAFFPTVKTFSCFNVLTHPYLKFDPFVLSEDGLDFEINTNSGNKGRSERVVGVAEKEAGLAHRAITDN